MIMKGKTKTHPSYGMVGLSHVSTTGARLFGSSILHRNYVSLKVMAGQVTRDLNNYRYHAKNEMCEVMLSASQFAEMITTPNKGFGVPCTISSFNGKRIDVPPQEDSETQKIIDEFSELPKEAGRKYDAIRVKLEAAMADARVSKKARQEISSILDTLRYCVDENLRYLEEEFREATERTVQSAKAEVEAFVTKRVYDTGLTALKKGSPLLE